MSANAPWDDLPDAPDPSTNVITAKTTQYGYQGDPYSDSLTSAGFGILNSKLQPGAISLTDSMRSKLKANPGDVIEATDAKGNIHRGYYTDRAPEPEDRVDFYKPQGYEKDFPDTATNVRNLGGGSPDLSGDNLTKQGPINLQKYTTPTKISDVLPQVPTIPTPNLEKLLPVQGAEAAFDPENGNQTNSASPIQTTSPSANNGKMPWDNLPDATPPSQDNSQSSNSSAMPWDQIPDAEEPYDAKVSRLASNDEYNPYGEYALANLDKIDRDKDPQGWLDAYNNQKLAIDVEHYKENNVPPGTWTGGTNKVLNAVGGAAKGFVGMVTAAPQSVANMIDITGIAGKNAQRDASSNRAGNIAAAKQNFYDPSTGTALSNARSQVLGLLDNVPGIGAGKDEIGIRVKMENQAPAIRIAQASIQSAIQDQESRFGPMSDEDKNALAEKIATDQGISDPTIIAMLGAGRLAKVIRASGIIGEGSSMVTNALTKIAESPKIAPTIQAVKAGAAKIQQGTGLSAQVVGQGIQKASSVITHPLGLATTVGGITYAETSNPERAVEYGAVAGLLGHGGDKVSYAARGLNSLGSKLEGFGQDLERGGPAQQELFPIPSQPTALGKLASIPGGALKSFANTDTGKGIVAGMVFSLPFASEAQTPEDAVAQIVGGGSFGAIGGFTEGDPNAAYRRLMAKPFADAAPKNYGGKVYKDGAPIDLNAIHAENTANMNPNAKFAIQAQRGFVPGYQIYAVSGPQMVEITGQNVSGVTDPKGLTTDQTINGKPQGIILVNKDLIVLNHEVGHPILDNLPVSVVYGLAKLVVDNVPAEQLKSDFRRYIGLLANGNLPKDQKISSTNDLSTDSLGNIVPGNHLTEEQKAAVNAANRYMTPDMLLKEYLAEQFSDLANNKTAPVESLAGHANTAASLTSKLHDIYTSLKQRFGGSDTSPLGFENNAKVQSEIRKIIQGIAKQRLQEGPITPQGPTLVKPLNRNIPIGSLALAGTPPIANPSVQTPQNASTPTQGVNIPVQQQNASQAPWQRDNDAYSDAEATGKALGLPKKQIQQGLKAAEAAQTNDTEQIVRHILGTSKPNVVRKVSEGKPLSQVPSVNSGVSVPLMITKQMEADLKTRGHTQDQINKMKPAEAVEILNKPLSSAPPIQVDQAIAKGKQVAAAQSSQAQGKNPNFNATLNTVLTSRPEIPMPRKPIEATGKLNAKALKVSVPEITNDIANDLHVIRTSPDLSETERGAQEYKLGYRAFQALRNANPGYRFNMTPNDFAVAFTDDPKSPLFTALETNNKATWDQFKEIFHNLNKEYGLETSEPEPQKPLAKAPSIESQPQVQKEKPLSNIRIQSGEGKKASLDPYARTEVPSEVPPLTGSEGIPSVGLRPSVRRQVLSNGEVEKGVPVKNVLTGRAINRRDPVELEISNQAAKDSGNVPKFEQNLHAAEQAIAKGRELGSTYQSAANEEQGSPTNKERGQAQDEAEYNLVPRTGVQKTMTPQSFDVYDSTEPSFTKESAANAKTKASSEWDKAQKKGGGLKANSKYNAFKSPKEVHQAIDEVVAANKNKRQVKGLNLNQAKVAQDLLDTMPTKRFLLKGYSQDKVIANVKNAAEGLENSGAMDDPTIKQAYDFLTNGKDFSQTIRDRNENMAKGYRGDGGIFTDEKGNDINVGFRNGTPIQIPDWKVQIVNAMEGGPSRTFYPEAVENAKTAGREITPNPLEESTNPFYKKLVDLGDKFSVNRPNGKISGIKDVISPAQESLRLDRIQDTHESPLELPPSSGAQRAAAFAPDISSESYYREAEEAGRPRKGYKILHDDDGGGYWGRGQSASDIIFNSHDEASKWLEKMKDTLGGGSFIIRSKNQVPNVSKFIPKGEEVRPEDINSKLQFYLANQASERHNEPNGFSTANMGKGSQGKPKKLETNPLRTSSPASTPKQFAEDYVAFAGKGENGQGKDLPPASEYAKSIGNLISPATIESLAKNNYEIEGGAEHRVFVVPDPTPTDPNGKKVVKVLRPGKYGISGDMFSYLTRMQKLNQLAPGLDIKVEGTLPAGKGRYEADRVTPIVTSMNYVDGVHPTEPELEEALTNKYGFVNMGNFHYKHPDTGLQIFDAHSGNFIRTPSGDYIPVDIDVEGDAKKPMFSPQVDEQGFYSQAEKNAEEGPNKATVAQWKARLGPQSGVKQEESKWLKLDQLFADKADSDSLTKQDVLDHLQANKISTPEHTFIQSQKGERENSKHARYAMHTLPGGTNYREVVVSMPTKEGEDSYFSPHYNQRHAPGYIAHLRLDDRVDDQGRKGTFINELQSDRHQSGREKGYKQDSSPLKSIPESWKIENNSGEYTPSNASFRIVDENGMSQGYGSTEQEAIEEALSNEGKGLEGNKSRIEDAPYRKDWGVQLFKRALRDAVANDHDWVGWTTGDTQADRYNLRKHVESINYDEKKKELVANDKDGNEVINEKGVTPEKLPDYIGKEAAEKIMAQPARFDQRLLSGQELEVGSKGMKGFYDDILPKGIQAYVKKWGGNVKKSNVDLPDGPQRVQLEDPNDEGSAISLVKEKGEKVPIWKVDITPKMREEVAKGQPLFSPDISRHEGMSGAQDYLEKKLNRVGPNLRPGLGAIGNVLQNYVQKPIQKGSEALASAGDKLGNYLKNVDFPKSRGYQETEPNEYLKAKEARQDIVNPDRPRAWQGVPDARFKTGVRTNPISTISSEGQVRPAIQMQPEEPEKKGLDSQKQFNSARRLITQGKQLGQDRFMFTDDKANTARLFVGPLGDSTPFGVKAPVTVSLSAYKHLTEPATQKFDTIEEAIHYLDKEGFTINASALSKKVDRNGPLEGVTPKDLHRYIQLQNNDRL